MCHPRPTCRRRPLSVPAPPGGKRRGRARTGCQDAWLSRDSGVSPPPLPRPLASCSEASAFPDLPVASLHGVPLRDGPVPVASSGSALPSGASCVCEAGVTTGPAPGILRLGEPIRVTRLENACDGGPPGRCQLRSEPGGGVCVRRVLSATRPAVAVGRGCLCSDRRSRTATRGGLWLEPPPAFGF